jgi:hypothetical protein
MGGDMPRARYLFFFMTGGYTSQQWYWEAVVMVRKAVIVLLIVAISDPKLRLYACMWAMGLFLVVHAIFTPYEIPVLARLEATSLMTIVATLNAGALFEIFTEASDFYIYWALSIVIITVNALAMAAFAVALFRSILPVLREAYGKNPHRFFFLSCLIMKDADSDLQIIGEAEAMGGELAEAAAALGQIATARSNVVAELREYLWAQHGHVAAVRRWQIRSENDALGVAHRAMLGQLTAADVRAQMADERQLGEMALTMAQGKNVDAL